MDSIAGKNHMPVPFLDTLRLIGQHIGKCREILFLQLGILNTFQQPVRRLFQIFQRLIRFKDSEGIDDRKALSHPDRISRTPRKFRAIVDRHDSHPFGIDKINDSFDLLRRQKGRAECPVCIEIIQEIYGIDLAQTTPLEGYHRGSDLVGVHRTNAQTFFAGTSRNILLWELTGQSTQHLQMRVGQLSVHLHPDLRESGVRIRIIIHLACHILNPFAKWHCLNLWKQLGYQPVQLSCFINSKVSVSHTFNLLQQNKPFTTKLPKINLLVV